MDIISFKLRDRLEVQPPGARSNSAMDGYRQRASYIDFVVNGKSLGDIFDVDESDLISMLSVEGLKHPPPVGREIFDYFKRAQTLVHELTFVIPCRYEFRRVHIYGCPECLDLGCGSVTMQLIETPDSVIWKRFDDGREEYANYMSSDKSYTDGALYNLWQEKNRDYAILDAFGRSQIEMDYEYLHFLRKGEILLEPNADILRGEDQIMDFAHIGPFEFDKRQYLEAFKALQSESKYSAQK